MVAMVAIVAGGGCDASDDGVECEDWWAGEPSSDAWRGAVAACQRAPACPEATSCDDPRWPVMADWALDQIATCFAGPCEERAECVVAALPPDRCWAAQVADQDPWRSRASSARPGARSEQVRFDPDDGEVGR